VSAPAGPCEWCGGPQQWTIIAGEMYVRCVDGCLPLDLEGLVPPHPNSEESLISFEGLSSGTILRMGGVPCEGGAADENTTKEPEKYRDLPF